MKAARRSLAGSAALPAPGLLMLGLLTAGRVHAAESAAPPDVPLAVQPAHGEWSTRGAPTLPRGRWELALFGTAHYGLADGVELGLQPLVFFVLPHVEAKLRVSEQGPFSVAVRPRLSYPSLFLNLIAKEGTGGLLPETTDVPQALVLEADAVASYRLAKGQLLSAWGGIAVAPRTKSDDFPLLDFPFLYPRFAPLYTSVVPRLGLAAEGRIVAGLFYTAELRAYRLPLADVDGAYALEPALDLDYRVSAHVALEAGVRTSVAHYPVGTRFHYLPHLDVKLGF